MNKVTFLFVMALVLVSCGTTKQTKNYPTPPPPPPMAKTLQTPKNIILMIGDGMGVTQITAGMYSNDNKIQFERFTNIGLHKSYSHSALTTDSAAGATAFACGTKTYNGAIGVNHDTIPQRTLLEEAEMLNMPTGLIATSTIVHATPASFIAHNKYRKNYEEIAADFLKTDIDLFIGGGKKFFTRRKDNRDLYAELRAKNYTVSDFFEKDLTEFGNLNGVDKFAYLTSEEDPLPVAQGRDYLEPATRMSVDFLNQKSGQNGFFLMVEGSQIDWGGHANNSEYIITELLDFNKAVKTVLDFAEADGNTLVVITADHETGGYAIDRTSSMNNIVGKFTSLKHTPDLIPVFAYGPRSEEFRGIYENTEIYHKIRKVMGWK